MKKKEDTRFNDLLTQTVAEIVSQEVGLPNSLITVCYVQCSSDQHYAKIVVSVLPENMAGSALRELRKKSGLIAKQLEKKSYLRQVPKITWAVDKTEARAGEVEKIIEAENELLSQWDK